jgi:hypothetical protein
VSASQDGQEQEKGRVVLFPPRFSLGRQKTGRKPDGTTQHAVEGLQKYEAGDEPDDYPRRMVINAIAFAFIVMLTLAGIWLAEQMAILRANQNCLAAGRQTCPEADMISRGRRSGLGAVDHREGDRRETPAQTDHTRRGG